MHINKITSIIISGLLIFSMTGCQPKEKEQEGYQQHQEIMIEEDLVVLEQEYTSMLNMINEVMNTLSNRENLGIMEAIELLNYIEQNRIEPTQELTIEFNNCIDKLIETGIQYLLASEMDKPEFEGRIYEILTEMEGICIQIEEKIQLLETTEL